ncbi:hypothetical protein KIL84_013258 [Mauremys mutica]|uniref:Uncharacterized protein n=1 Tax=Mauremys mutica TaxID=74926 RepID=A0A9D3WWJ8_9SAUR|nr:hypothetical protein KIL84_013258 [Mauremys mutica]
MSGWGAQKESQLPWHAASLPGEDPQQSGDFVGQVMVYGTGEGRVSQHSTHAVLQTTQIPPMGVNAVPSSTNCYGIYPMVCVKELHRKQPLVPLLLGWLSQSPLKSIGSACRFGDPCLLPLLQPPNPSPLRRVLEGNSISVPSWGCVALSYRFSMGDCNLGLNKDYNV